MRALRIILFGATGMVGRGVLRECLLDREVTEVVAVGRSPVGVSHPKLRDLVLPDLMQFGEVAPQFAGFSACFFTLGVTSAGMSEEEYTRVTYDLTIAVAEPLARINPGMTFVFVSGAGTDPTERGKTMWARVKGRAENAVLRMPLRAIVFRPGVIQPLHGITSRTPAYRIFYAATKPLLPLLKALFPRFITTTELIGRAMLVAAKEGSAERILESSDINALAARYDPGPPA